MFAFPLAAAVVAAAFAARAGGAAVRSRTPALGAWSFALAQFAAASAALAWGILFGWSPSLYRVYYLFGAILNTAWLGVGTVVLLAPKTIGRIVLGAAVAGSLIVGVRTMTTELAPRSGAALAGHDVPRGRDVMPGGVRAYSRYLSIGGSAVVVAGLGWSIVRSRRHAAGLALLAAGVVVVAVASELGRAGFVVAFSAGLATGVTVMYVGFVRTRQRTSG